MNFKSSLIRNLIHTGELRAFQVGARRSLARRPPGSRGLHRRCLPAHRRADRRGRTGARRAGRGIGTLEGGPASLQAPALHWRALIPGYTLPAFPGTPPADPESPADLSPRDAPALAVATASSSRPPAP
nr:hypothetical protein [Arthrobacter sp. J3.37]